MKMKRILFFHTIVLLGVFCNLGVMAKSWEVKGDEFSKGEMKGVVMQASGKLSLARELQPYDGVKGMYVWDLSAAPNEDAVYVGMGAPASIMRIKDGQVEHLYTTSEAHVLSVLALEDGSVLAATAPRGIIYKISDNDEVTVFADLDVNYVWDMTSLTGEKWPIYCATGTPGQLLELSQDGSVRQVHKSSENNLLCLVPHPARDALYVGSQPGGLVYEIGIKGDVSILYDAAESEVRSLLLDAAGALYAGTAQADSNGGQMPRTAGNRNQRKGNSGGSDSPSKNRKRNSRRPSENNSVYKIVPGTGADKVLRLDQTLGLSLAMSPAGNVLVGTGGDGRMFIINPRGDVSSVDVGAGDDVTAMVKNGQKDVIVGTSNAAQLLKRTKSFAKDSHFTTRVYDAGYLSKWGRVSKTAKEPDGTTIDIQMRVGNTAQPDATWTEWKDATKTAVEFPLSRFCQLKANFSRKPSSNRAPELISMVAYYRQSNRRPNVRELHINGGKSSNRGGKGASNTGQNANRGREGPQIQRRISWQAEDPNGDPLVFDLQYRGVHEQEWKVIKEGIEKRNQVSWDTRRVPDGEYLVRLRASDRIARPEQDSMTDTKTSPPFLIDNTRPRIVILDKKRHEKTGSYVVCGKVIDNCSVIEEISMSTNGQEWEAVFPSDGLFDGRVETFKCSAEYSRSGEQVLVFIARDAAGNVGSGKCVLGPTEADAAME